jgi:hypothetical protein
MERKDNGFFQVEMLIALALAALFLGAFAKHFLLAHGQDCAMRKRVIALNCIIRICENESPKASEGVTIREVRSQPDKRVLEEMRKYCGKGIQIPQGFVIKEVVSEKIGVLCRGTVRHA